MNLYEINRSRYVLDALYGIVHLPKYIWEVLFIPEMQRLRELRLNNINSLYFTGGANINRYEHSLGTCYLALQCIEANLDSLDEKDKMLITLAALFHDLYNAAFGHSVEYIEEFSPENLFPYKVTGREYSSFKYKHTDFEPIYFGMCEEISSVLVGRLGLSVDDIERIAQYINGNGEYGPLISGSMDLDNIDNIFRMSYHMGLLNDTQKAVRIARSVWAKGGELHIKDHAVPLVYDWIRYRERLYRYLLLNPDEFAAKCMLTEAIERSNEGKRKAYAWYDTDFQLLEKLLRSSSDVSNIVSRMMKGCVYGCFGIYRTSKTEKLGELSDRLVKMRIEHEINELFKPEASVSIPDFTEHEQGLIRGIQGIRYDRDKGVLRMTYRANKDAIDRLARSKLKRHKSSIQRMYLAIQDRTSRYRLKSPSFGIHVISDINKTKRKVILRTSEGMQIIGRSSDCLYIGVFIRNTEFANFNTENNAVLASDAVHNVKHEIKRYLMEYLDDQGLEDLKLYSEAVYDQ